MSSLTAMTFTVRISGRFCGVRNLFDSILRRRNQLHQSMDGSTAGIANVCVVEFEVQTAMDICRSSDEQIERVNACELHDQFGYVKTYCTDDKIKQWRETKTTVTSRWVEIFCHSRAVDCEFKDVAKIVEYVLCLPATSASVERVFSAVNRTWTEEKTRLKIETLTAILLIKYNLKFSCTQFYTYLNKQPMLLRQIAGTDEYKRKRESADEI